MMEAVVSRLEAIATKLEETEARLASQAPSVRAAPLNRAVQQPSASTVAVVTATATNAVGGAAGAYERQVMQHVRKSLDSAEAIGGEVLKATRILASGFEKELAVVQASEQCQKPSDAELQQLVQPVGEQMMAASSLTEGPRSKYLQHFKLVSEAMQGLTWLVYTGPACGMQPPAQHVQECWSATEFYANKVLMEWRSKDPNHVTWVHSVKELLLALKDFCKQHFPTGLSWNASGIPLSQYKPGTTTSAPPPARSAAAAKAPAPPVAPSVPPKPASGGPPPPPPPPPPGGPGSLIKDQPAAVPAKPAGPSMSALFAEINKGEGVTAGLKKVTADMKTKNRTDRSGAVPSEPVVGIKAAAKAPTRVAPSGLPRIECEQDRKWVVENQSGNREIIISHTQPRHTVYIYNCINSTIQVRGKVNAISMDKCRRTGLVFEDVVASCEIVNCSSVEVQSTGFVPTVAVDKCDGCQVYLSRQSLTADITTAKSSEVNIVIPGETEDADPLETAIPEQFVTRFRDGQWLTEAVSHSAA